MMENRHIIIIKELIQREIGHLNYQLGNIKDVPVQLAIQARINDLNETLSAVDLIPTY